jgi:serine/threonine protein kinase
LHERGVAHGDISLENAMLRRCRRTGRTEVALVDFGATVVGNTSEAVDRRGKPSYQAPEMHRQASYDARLADLFSCGVVAYGLAVGNYPWKSTKPGVSTAFELAYKYGVGAFLERRKVPVAEGSSVRLPLASLLSRRYLCLLTTLLDMEPCNRHVNLLGLQ